jgi:hypothetical protein
MCGTGAPQMSPAQSDPPRCDLRPVVGHVRNCKHRHAFQEQPRRPKNGRAAGRLAIVFRGAQVSSQPPLSTGRRHHWIGSPYATSRQSAPPGEPGRAALRQPGACLSELDYLFLRRRKKKSEINPVPTRADEIGSGTGDPPPLTPIKPVQDDCIGQPEPGVLLPL